MKVLQAARLMLCGHVMLFTFGCSRKSSPVAIEELPNKLVLFKMSTGNVIGTVGDERALLIGTPSAESTPAISKFIATKTKSSILIVVIADSPIDESQGDAGWGRKGAFVVMQENGLGRLGGHSMGLPLPLPPQLSQLGVDRPKISFSDVIAFDFKDEAVHIVHQAPGFSNGDWLVHFHIANLVYFGRAFPGDGYPDIDLARGGSLDGLITQLTPWTDGSMRVIPMRGEPTDGNTVREFLEMLKTVRDRVDKLISQGASEQKVEAADVTKEFDGRWGRHGRTASRLFVHEAFLSEMQKQPVPQRTP